MKILKEIEPDFLSKIDKTENIIFCCPPSDSCIIESQMPDVASIILTQDINLSNASTISQNVITVDFKPRIKVSFPAGLKLNITEPGNSELTGGIFDKIFSSYDSFYCHTNPDEKENFDHIIIENLLLTLYIDVIQMRKKNSAIYLKKNTPIAEIFFSWYIQTKNNFPQIKELYIIRDLYLYQEFTKTI